MPLLTTVHSLRKLFVFAKQSVGANCSTVKCLKGYEAA